MQDFVIAAVMGDEEVSGQPNLSGADLLLGLPAATASQGNLAPRTTTLQNLRFRGSSVNLIRPKFYAEDGLY